MITALTRYGTTIPKSFADRKAAVAWASENAERYGCARIVRTSGERQRTIWKQAVAEQVAA